MAITKVETALAWATASSKSVAAAATEASDAITIDATTWAIEVEVKADNDGTPAAGDTVTVRLLASLGQSADDFDTAKHGAILMRLDVSNAATGEDPAKRTVRLPVAGIKKLKIQTVNNAATNAVTVSGRIVEIKG